MSLTRSSRTCSRQESCHSGLQLDSPCRFIPHAIVRCSRALDQRHGPPRKQGLRPHAIADRPATLTPSISPKLGASSQHQELHRCALWRIFRPAFRREGSTRILRHPLLHNDYITIGRQNQKASEAASLTPKNSAYRDNSYSKFNFIFLANFILFADFVQSRFSVYQKVGDRS
jgi:hypothetical protein